MAIKKGQSNSSAADEHEDEQNGDEEEEEEEEHEDEGDGEGDGDGDGTELDEETEALVSAIVERVADQTNRTIDSRINSFVKTLKRDYGLSKKQKDDDEDGKPPAGATRVRGLDRVLRGAIRDAVSDEFEDQKERKTALAIAKRIGDARGLGEDEDEDEVAEEIIESVKSFLEDAKDHYESALTKELEQRGLLTPDQAKQPRKKGGKQSTGKSPTELFEEGKKKAQERFGQEKE